MKLKRSRLKIGIIVVFALGALFAFSGNKELMPAAEAIGGGPPAGFSGAPGENSCAACHFDEPGTGEFLLSVPSRYIPGQTYFITARHINSSPSRLRWGFQMTALAGMDGAGSFSNLSANTQTVVENGRPYIHHTSAGTFPGQAGGATWQFRWTAPSANVGDITFYSTGNQANNDTTADGDELQFSTAVSKFANAAVRRFMDLDGDGKTDLSISRVNSGAREWWWRRSSDNLVPAVAFGVPSDIITPADFTGDGKTDVAFFRPSSGQWFVLRSEDNNFFAFNFGANGDIPAPGDFDGDGKADPALYRASSGTWFILRSSDQQVSFATFGAPADRPAVADFDGDNKSDISIWKPDVGQWWRINSGNSSLSAYQFGAVGDKPLPGDFTGDGKADVAIFRPASATWFVLRSEDLNFYAYPFGAATDIPAAGDYDGDGVFDSAVFRPSEAVWYIAFANGTNSIANFGAGADRPLPNAYIP